MKDPSRVRRRWSDAELRRRARCRRRSECRHRDARAPAESPARERPARMSRRRRPKRHEQVVRRVRALGHRHEPNRRRHVRVGNPQQPRGHFLERVRTGWLGSRWSRAPSDRLPGGSLTLDPSHALRQFMQPLLRRPAIERKRKPLRHDPPQNQVAVRHRQWPAASVAGRPRVGPGALGPDGQLHAVEAADRAAARRDGFDRHDRCDEPHPGFLVSNSSSKRPPS